MKKLLIMIGMLLMFAVPGYAIEMPDISVDGYGLYNVGTKEYTFAPGISANVFTALNGIVEGNAGVAFPTSNEDENRNYVAGPILDVNVIKLLDRIKTVDITSEKTQLSAGFGVMLDVFHLNSSDIKNSIYPAVHVRFIF